MDVIMIECQACNATGVYVGFAERKGEGVICNCCGGTGCQELRYKAFTKRRRRIGITKVRQGSGLFIDKPGEKDWIPYEEFLKKG